MGGAVKTVVSGVVEPTMRALGNIMGSATDAGNAGGAPAAAAALQQAQQANAYKPPPEMRGTQQDAQGALDFQNMASRRKASGSGAQMLASAGTTGSNAGTKTLLGS